MERQMMVYKRFSTLIVVCLAVLPMSSRVAPTSAQSPESAQISKKVAPSNLSEGERKFAQNCSRCHDAPQGFSPTISGTIVRHMRVRASLSKRDEEDILSFLNP